MGERRSLSRSLWLMLQELHLGSLRAVFATSFCCEHIFNVWSWTVTNTYRSDSTNTITGPEFRLLHLVHVRGLTVVIVMSCAAHSVWQSNPESLGIMNPLHESPDHHAPGVEGDGPSLDSTPSFPARTQVRNLQTEHGIGRSASFQEGSAHVQSQNRRRGQSQDFIRSDEVRSLAAPSCSVVLYQLQNCLSIPTA